MIPDHYNPACGCESCRKLMKDGRGGPLSLSEADLLALESRHDYMVTGSIRIREHLCNCEHSDQKTLDAFDELLKYIGLHDQVVAPEPITQPAAEMAVHEGE